MPIRGPDPQLGQPGPLAHKIFVVLIKRHSRYGRPTQADVSFSKRELMRFILSSPSGPARHSPTTDFLGAGSGEASSSIFTPTASKSWSHSRSHKTEPACRNRVSKDFNEVGAMNVVEGRSIPNGGLRARRAPLKRGLSARLGEGVMNRSRGRPRIDWNVATISEMKDMP